MVKRKEISPLFFMNFYATIEPCRKLKNLFNNLSQYYIVDVDTILEQSNLDVDKPSHRYLINAELERLIVTGIKSKRYYGFIYINSSMDFDVIESLKDYINTVENSVIDSFVILDDYDVPKMKKYYKLFDEVIFFPSIKKSKIINCYTKQKTK